MARASSGQTTRRRYPFRDRDVTATHTAKLGSWTARAFFVSFEAELDQIHQLALVAAAYHLDMLLQAGRPGVVYPDDVADIVGIAQARAGNLLSDLKRTGLLVGTAQSGYGFAGPMVAQDA